MSEPVEISRFLDWTIDAAAFVFNGDDDLDECVGVGVVKYEVRQRSRIKLNTWVITATGLDAGVVDWEELVDAPKSICIG